MSDSVSTLRHSSRKAEAFSPTSNMAIRREGSGKQYSTALFDPESYLGRFESLPAYTQRAIVDTVVKDDYRRTAWRELNSGFITAIRLLRLTAAKLRRSKLRRVADIIQFVTIILESGPSRLYYAILKRADCLKDTLSSQPSISATLKKAGLEARQLAICYGRNIPQIPSYRSYWHDPYRHITYGVILGIDFIPTTKGCWYVESNLDCALRFERNLVYDRDPFVVGLLKFASRENYRHLVLLANNASRVNKLMEQHLQDESRILGLKVTIVEDSILNNSVHLQSYGIPAIVDDQTLVARIKFYHTSLDYLFHHKTASYKALDTYRRNFPDPAILLPTCDSQLELRDWVADDPFPNLVYKFPERDNGRGVHFLKARSIDDAKALIQKKHRLHATSSLTKLYALIDDHTGLLQSYIRSEMLPDRRLYIIRSHVLVTPVGNSYLSAHRVISGFPVPNSLASGLVSDPRPFIVNYSAGARYEPVPQDEQEQVRVASLAVAKGLAWAASYGFITGPDTNVQRH